MNASKKQKIHQGEATKITSVKAEDVIPKNFSVHKFDGIVLESARAKSDANELWLFQLPPEIEASDICSIDITIPEKTVIPFQNEAALAIRNGSTLETINNLLSSIPAGNVRIKAFEFNGIRYQLFETPITEATDIINFWSSTEFEDGELVCGKPFERYFSVIADSLNLPSSFALGPITNIPSGYNTPFTSSETKTVVKRTIAPEPVKVKKEKKSRKEKS